MSRILDRFFRAVNSNAIRTRSFDIMLLGLPRGMPNQHPAWRAWFRHFNIPLATAILALYRPRWTPAGTATAFNVADANDVALTDSGRAWQRVDTGEMPSTSSNDHTRIGNVC